MISLPTDIRPTLPRRRSPARGVSLVLSLAGASGVAALAVAPPGGVAWAAQTDVAISMTAPPATARVRGPATVGARAGSPFLYTIPATGQAPLTFAATGLPAGLALGAATGTISGTTPAAGSYPIAVTVSNALGDATATLTLVAGDTLCLTPPLGWNSYDSFGATVTESETMAAAQAMKTQLQPSGWNTVVVDYLWFDSEQTIDANGRYLPSPSRFPSATGTLGFKPLADKIHALGLLFGIHIMRGIPRKTVTANAPIAGSTYTASQAANTGDPCPWDSHMWGVHGDTAAGQAWYDSIFAQYATWGIDFVKVDDMINNQVTPLAYHQAEVDAIRKAIDKTGRSIVLSLSPGPMQTANAAHLNANANMWRMVNDFWDTNGLSSLGDVFTASGNWQGVAGLTAGHWPDADMLPLGYLGPRCPVHTSAATALSHNQQVTVMSLWGILPSPLIFGGNLPDLTTDATGPFTIALLTNDEVLAVNQDAAGTHAKRVAQQGTTEVWARDLSDGRKAVALFNRGTQDATVSVTFAQLGVTGTPAVRDLWHRADVTGVTSGLSVNVPYSGALMYTLSPASSGAGGGGGGGAGGGGRGGGSAGATGAGGRAAGTGGAGTGGSGGGTGGAIDAGAGSGGAATGGSAPTDAGAGSGGAIAIGTGGATGSGGRSNGTGGATASGGATGSGGATDGGPGITSGSSTGCACDMGAHAATTPRVLGTCLAILAVGLRRRRRRRRR